MASMTRPPPATVHFVHGRLDRWSDVVSRDEPPDRDALADRLVEGRDVWTIGTYVELRRRGLPVALGPRFVPGAMCVAHYDDVVASSFPFRSYVVAIRADRDPTFLCDVEILQNPTAVSSSSEVHVPHWTQPGLIPRDPARGCLIANVGYLGRARNLASRFRSVAFETDLRSLGISLEIHDEPGEWRDYSRVDVVLAVRDGSASFLAGKPASKLVNAWLAGCPALLGPESAYVAMRTSDLDYLEVESPEEVIRALTRLRDDPELHARMVDHGRRRARAFDSDAVANRWETLLFDKLLPGYERWRRLSSAVKITRFAVRAVRKRAFGTRYTRLPDAPSSEHLGGGSPQARGR